MGLLFSKSGSFALAKKELAAQANKAMFSILKMSRKFSLSIDLQIELFMKMVKPILLYGCEIWGFSDITILERVQLKFLKYAMHMKQSTPNFMVYGEVGVYPLRVDVHTRMISFWSKLVDSSNITHLSSNMYDIAYSLFCRNICKFDWFHCIQNILTKCGLLVVWDTQSFVNKEWLVSTVKQRLRDLYIQDWFSAINDSTSGSLYRYIKTKFEVEKYLNVLPFKLRKLMTSIRTRNHKLPIETGRWVSIPNTERMCNLCKEEIGDEFHYILCCKILENDRKLYIGNYYRSRPSNYKFIELLNGSNLKQMKQLCYFLEIVFEQCRSPGNT